jgi:hypothetical protein
MGSSDALHAGVVVEASADRMLAVEEVAAAAAAAAVQHTGLTTIFAGVAEAGSYLAGYPRVDSTSDPARHRCSACRGGP